MNVFFLKIFLHIESFGNSIRFSLFNRHQCIKYFFLASLNIYENTRATYNNNIPKMYILLNKLFNLSDQVWKGVKLPKKHWKLLHLCWKSLVKVDLVPTLFRSTFTTIRFSLLIPMKLGSWRQPEIFGLLKKLPMAYVIFRTA